MLIRINAENPRDQDIYSVVNCLREGGVIIYPTDTVYALGCDISNTKALEKVCRLKGIKLEKSNFSFVCADLSSLSEYTRAIPNQVFRVMKRALPGPFTFILEASNQVPKLLKQNKKTVGIRVPDNKICKAIVEELGHPIISTSLHDNSDDILEYFSDPEVIHRQYGEQVDMVVDGGFGNIHPSTVIDCSGEEMMVIRQGLGDAEAVLN